jgi:HEAT repeat protein
MSKVMSVPRLVAVLALSGGILGLVSAVEPPANEAPQSFQGKTAVEWIKVLKESPLAKERAQAAEALGYIARAKRLTYGGFSDVPIDSPEPPKLDPPVLEPIVSALSQSLTDSDDQVRASSAIALSWMGTRAKAAVPVLVKQLDDAQGNPKTNVLKAIGSIGPLQNDTTRRLEEQLATATAPEQIEITEAMRKAGAAPETYVPTLIKILGEKEAHSAAMQLGQLGDPAIPALLTALQDRDVERRRFAAYAIANLAGWGNLTKNREIVEKALVERLFDPDHKVVWHALQAIGSIHADPHKTIPALTLLLAHRDQDLAEQSAESLGEFGSEAKSALPGLIQLLARREGRAAPVDHAIHQIGIDRASADQISKLKIKAEVWWLLGPMLEYPDAAAEFLKRNPQAVDVAGVDRDRVIDALRSRDPRYKPVQELLYQSEQLPLEIIATLGEPQFLPMLERRHKVASKHAQAQLAACMRACGRPAKKVISISDSKPGDFKPASAWPGTDKKRRAENSHGHGDGFTPIIITGRILLPNGKPAQDPKVYRVNDSFLLGERKPEEEPLVYDPKTGRFVYVTSIFAAYSIGEGQAEPGPYQTGSSLISLEAAGCKPLQIHFYDEMPAVEITLSEQALVEKRD